MDQTDPHPFDPNLLFQDCQHEHRIYGDTREHVYAVVDYEDYLHFCRWAWEPIADKHGKKLYLRRSVGRGAASRPLYLHVAIMQHTGKRRPSKNHTMVDHKNGDSLDCRRVNLRWATPSMNRRNIRK